MTPESHQPSRGGHLMSLSAKLRRAPQRLVTGAYILNSGVSKLNADDEAAKGVHGMAVGTYPVLGKVQPNVFMKGLAVGEIAVGSLVLLPIVPPAVAGAALVGFSGALLNVYWRTPGMHEPGDPRPTHQGQPIAKDVWMLGIGASMIADALIEPAHDKRVEIGATVSEKRAQKSRRAGRKAKKHAAKGNAEFAKQARQLQAEAAERAQKAAKKAAKRAEKSAAKAAKRLAEVRAEYAPVAAEKAKQAREAARDLADEYGPVAAEKAKQARETAREWAEEYGPLAAEKAKQAREAARDLADEYGPVAAEKAKLVRDAARDLADEYGTVAAEKTKQAREAAKAAGARARERVAG
jgi:uncharacterized membrane protein YphA (DoxX/SURF4 family)